jgi:hypothetical protein
MASLRKMLGGMGPAAVEAGAGVPGGGFIQRHGEGELKPLEEFSGEPETRGTIGDESRSGESPRERAATPPPMPQTSQMRAPGGSVAAPSKPSSPTPMAGSTMLPPEQGVTPFEPMNESGGMAPRAQMRNPGMPVAGGGSMSGGLLGSLGGLQGGGLGVPFDPASDQQSDPMSLLMELLQGRKGMF